MASNDVFSSVVKRIIEQQYSIIGPMAVNEANKVNGIKASSDLSSVRVTGESKKILTDLVHQYEKLFGQASVEACKDSIKELLPKLSPGDIPDFLK